MELCVPRRWLSHPCSAFVGLLLIGIIALAFLLVGGLIALAVRRLCCRSRAVGHAADEEGVAEDDDDRSKDFSYKKFGCAFAGKQHDDPKSILPTMVRSPDASPEPAAAWARRFRSPQASSVTVRNSASSRPHSAVSLSIPGVGASRRSEENPPPAVDPGLPDFSPVSRRSLKEFSYESLAAATTSFDGGNELGRGRSGVLYAGDLLFDDGLNKQVAIKFFHKNNINSNQIREDLRRKYFLEHRNLVTLFGYCLHERKLYLVYDRMHCSNLDYELFAKNGATDNKPVMTLAQRHNIIKDTAQGLFQLHMSQAFHGCLKASNIMLEACSSGYRARLGDFRYSKLLAEEATTDLTMMTGTSLGSLLYQNDPAQDQTWDVAGPSLETDMLHFGGVMLEIVCGRRLTDRNHLPAGTSSLVHCVQALHQEERLHMAADEDSKKAGDFDDAQADELLRLGLECCHHDPKRRPTVIHVLEKLAEIATNVKAEPKVVVCSR